MSPPPGSDDDAPMMDAEQRPFPAAQTAPSPAEPPKAPSVALVPVDHDPFADDPAYERSSLLPMRINKATGEREWAWPGVITDLIAADDTGYVRGQMAPWRTNQATGDGWFAWPGAIRDPVQAWSRSMDALRAGQKPSQADALTISLAMSGGSSLRGTNTLTKALREAPAAAEGAADTFAAESAGLAKPPAMPQRPFEADYPAGAPADATGRLTTDMDGRPLVAPRVAGRRVVGGPDRALAPEDAEAIVEDAVGVRPEAVEEADLPPETMGLLQRRWNPDTGQPEWSLRYRKALSTIQGQRVVGHETGHLIDELAGEIPTAGLESELEGVYHTLDEGSKGVRSPITPRTYGYTDEDAPRELMAEAIRAYMANPNYLKTVAPNAAAAIRAAVNNHPELSRIVQFNSGGLGLAGLALAGKNPDDEFPLTRLIGPRIPGVPAQPGLVPVDHDPFAGSDGPP